MSGFYTFATFYEVVKLIIAWLPIFFHHAEALVKTIIFYKTPGIKPKSLIKCEPIHHNK